MGITDRGNALSQVIVSDENIAPIPRLFHGEDIPILSRGGPLIPRHQFISWNVHAGSLVHNVVHLTRFLPSSQNSRYGRMLELAVIANSPCTCPPERMSIEGVTGSARSA